MYNNEILFVDKFLSMLKKFKISSIPFKNEQYRKGVTEMKRYFTERQANLDADLMDIKFLFMDEGEGDFAEAIMGANDGKMISFELRNPYYENATVKMQEEDADYLLQDKELKLTYEFIEGITKAFCNGAGLSKLN